MGDEERALRIRCGTHAERAVAVVCGHLLVGDGERVHGFIENSSDPDDLQGWCEDCERMFVREGEMTEAFLAFNDMRVVCDLCYAGIRERHTRPAP